MKGKISVGIAVVLTIVVVLGASRLRAQGVLTLEGLAEMLTLLTADQEQLTERMAALEAAAASANWLAGIPISEENRCTPYESDDYRYPQSLEAQIMAEMKGSFYSPYTGETFAWGKTSTSNISSPAVKRTTAACARPTSSRAWRSPATRST